MYGNDEFSRQMLGKNDYVSIAKGVQEKFMLSSRKNILMLNLDFPNFACFNQNGVLAGFQVLILYVYAVSIKMQFYWLMQSIGISHTKILFRK